MPDLTEPRTAGHGLPRPAVVPLLIATAVIIAALLYQWAWSPARSFNEPPAAGDGALRMTVPPTKPAASSAPSLASLPGIDPGRARAADRSTVTQDDGVLPDGVTATDDEYPGIANLDPHLLAALRAATTDAAEAGIRVSVTSGWRSAGYQDELRREAVSEHGSASEAARWVATADTSPHVSGAAVDIGPAAATRWLSRHGARYGLCQVYRNEPWHYELRPRATHGGCPRMYADAADDPRMQP